MRDAAIRRVSGDQPDVNLEQQVFHRAAIDVFQRIDEADFDVLIDFVDAAIRWSEFDDLRADLRNETTIRGAAGGRQFCRHAGFGLDRIAHRIAQCAFRREEGMAADRPFQIIFEAMLVENGMHAFLQTVYRAGGAEAEVEIDDDITRNDVRCAGTTVDV